MMATVKVVIPGIEKVTDLIKKHYDLVGQLEDNLSEIYKERLELEIELNHSCSVTKSEKKTEQVNEQLSDQTSGLAYELECAFILNIKQAYEKIKTESTTFCELESGINHLISELNWKSKALGVLTREGMEILLKKERDNMQLELDNEKSRQ